ncbi:MAG: anthranilate synthase component I [Pseudomonadota bacterium]
MAQIIPEFSAFADGFEAGNNQIVYARLPADLDTAVSVMLKLTGAEKDSFVLESVTGGEVRGRYSIIGMRPDIIWECHGDQARINRQARYDADAFTPVEDGPLASLRGLIAESQIALPDGLPAASAGLFGFLGYDMIRLVEHLPDVNPDPLGLPDARMVRPSVVAILDGVKGDVIVVAPAWAGSGLSAKAAFAQAAERVMDAVRALERPVPMLAPTQSEPLGEPVSNFSKPEYLAAVERAKDYIKAGDIFQVVPAQRWAQDFPAPPFAFYRALRRTNPSPYMFFFNFGAYQIVGASPEILVQLKGHQVTIRPIAGTRPRGATPSEDQALEKDLLADPKELAEHLMLLDLGRNDVGRVAKIGSVTPTEKFVIERYSHVMHITSNVIGELSEGEDALSALLAGLPAGTLSGAPKVRAMQIIDELEPEKRGVYGGGCGYFSSGGDMDICIALRTAILKDGKLYSQAGGGVVYDSDPEAEFQETVNKAKAIWSAARDALRFSGGNL